MLTIILVVGYFLFCVGMAFFLDYRTKKRKLNETAVEYSTGKNSMGLFMAFSLMCGNLISSSYIIGNSSAVIEHDLSVDLLRLYHRLGADLCLYPHLSLHLL